MPPQSVDLELNMLHIHRYTIIKLIYVHIYNQIHHALATTTTTTRICTKLLIRLLHLKHHLGYQDLQKAVTAENSGLD
jgi:hypothetical protein